MQLFVFKIGKIKLQNDNLENYFKKITTLNIV
jgi:hypothetical protein